MPKTIAILYICTGSYRVFWPGFYENFRKNFLPELDKTFFVFTDAAQVAGEDNPDVRRIPQKALPWPYSTLQRFDAFLSQEAALAGYDLALFFYEGGGQSLRQILAAHPEARRIAIVTGSEGGFAAEEAAAAAEAGAVTVGLGPRILRCETAPLAALAAVLTLTGDLE